MTPVLIGKGHILGGWWSKIEVIQVLGIYIYNILHGGHGAIRTEDGGARCPELHITSTSPGWAEANHSDIEPLAAGCRLS